MQTIRSGETTSQYCAVPFTSVSSTGLQTRLTSALTFTTRIIKADQTSAAGGGTYDQIDSVNAPGCRRYTPSASDTSVTGPGILRIAAAGMETREIPFNVVSFNPFVSPGVHGASAFLAIQNSETSSAHKVVPFTTVSNAALQTRLDASALTFTVYIIKADGTTATGAGTVVQPDATNAVGCCFYVPATSDINVNGETIIRISGSGGGNTMEPRELTVTVVPYDPYTVGSGSYPAITNSTTIESIRDRAIAVIAGITPSRPATGAGNLFRAYRNEGDGDFIKFCETNPSQAFRRYQVRGDNKDEVVEVSNTDYDERHCTLTITIAYPQTSRTGPDDALDRDDAMDSDFHKLDYQLGIYGRSNFSIAVNSSYPDAVPYGCTKEVVKGNACDFLVITAAYTYRRSSQ